SLFFYSISCGLECSAENRHTDYPVITYTRLSSITDVGLGRIYLAFVVVDFRLYFLWLKKCPQC
ncbi:MAG TPA: hypothetical protein PKH22_24590, partial [Leptospiraceae bacterium]|nr:hypothetical protein [Leptospiraceae bacterium]